MIPNSSISANQILLHNRNNSPLKKVASKDLPQSIIDFKATLSISEEENSKRKFDELENKENVIFSNKKPKIEATKVGTTDVDMEDPENSLKRTADDKITNIILKKSKIHIETLNDLEKSNEKNGILKKVYKNGLTEICTYSKGVKEGSAISKFANGDIEACNFVNGIKEGPAKRKYANKEVLEFIFKNGEREGPAKRIFANGDVEECNYLNGTLEGPLIYKHANGDVEACNFVNGKVEGLVKRTYANKDISEFIYKNGVREGPAKYVFAAGGVKEYNFVNDVQEGPEIYTFANKDILECININGKKEGPAKRIYANGDVLDFTFVNNEKKGPVKYTNANGDVLAPTFINGLEDNSLVAKDLLLNLLFKMGNHPDIHNLENNIKRIDSGTHSILCGNHVVFLSKLSKNDPICSGVVNLLEKSFAKGGLGKVYKVHSEMELVFKLSRKKLKSKNSKGELVPETTNEKLLKAEKGSAKGLLAKNDLMKEYEMMQFIKENVLDRTGLNCEAFALVSYKNQMGVFLKKFDCNGLEYLINNPTPTFESRFSTMTQIFQGLRTMHDLKIMHRDLKLENILIKNKAEVPIEANISDFGSACHAKSLFTANNPHPNLSDILGVGTPRSTSAFLVKEIDGQLKLLKKIKFGSKNYKKTSEEVINLLEKSDLFSFSILAYILITSGGPLPFQSFQIGKYLSFDKDLTASEQLKCFDQMRDNLSNAFKNAKFDEDEAIKNIEIIMSNFERGLKGKSS
jgi:antitoxin component YwqK of YwqJK toxin-antitoxin module